MGLSEEALDRVDQVADARGALAALLGPPTGRALVLQCVEAIGMEWYLLLKLIYQVGGDAVHLSPVACRQALFARVKRMESWVVAGVGARECASSRVAVRV